MRKGKLTPDELEDIVLSKLPDLSPAVTSGPGHGLDCAAVSLDPKCQIVVSSDPVTGADNDIGSIALHVSCNDLAAYGVKPDAVLFVLLAPVDAQKEQIEKIMEQAAAAAKNLNVDIVGGHTEVSDAVNRFVITTTAIGMNRGTLVQSGDAKDGDSIIMTKTAALEGTAILAADYPDRFKDILSEGELDTARNMVNQISVVAEGILAGQSGLVHAMHDATEGGILGAAWEMSEAAGLGVRIYHENIPVHSITQKICASLKIDPCKLISSGSMLIATDRPEQVTSLLAGHRIDSAVIGKMTAESERLLIVNGNEKLLEPPQQDELYKIV